ncbi:hypothetical protein BHE74_00052545 [Ensete ventricosum]|nr:hypothetical protein BHE74_00052545 [Ensete ventricosum]
MRKLICVGRVEIEKLGRNRLGLLENVPVCASSPAVVSVRSWSSGIGRNLGVRLGKSVVGVVERGSGGGSTGARAYIVGVVDHPYLATWLPLWLTLSSYASTTPVVLAMRDASTGRGIGLTCVRSAVRPLGIRPYLCQVGRTTIGAPIPASDQLPTLGRPRQRASCPKQR